jgi:hypothetical protein
MTQDRVVLSPGLMVSGLAAKLAMTEGAGNQLSRTMGQYTMVAAPRGNPGSKEVGGTVE